MADKITDKNLLKLRKYIASEAQRLGKSGSRVVYRVDLSEIEEEEFSYPLLSLADPMERDLDLLFGANGKKDKNAS